MANYRLKVFLLLSQAGLFVYTLSLAATVVRQGWIVATEYTAVKAGNTYSLGLGRIPMLSPVLEEGFVLPIFF